jgi:hypothetical protein
MDNRLVASKLNLVMFRFPTSNDTNSPDGLDSGEIVRAEIHWYEATGIGKREFKIKRII